jgi:hypothetical protein
MHPTTHRLQSRVIKNLDILMVPEGGFACCVKFSRLGRDSIKMMAGALRQIKTISERADLARA